MFDQDHSRTTKILFVESDDMSFQVRQCIAKVIEALSTVELFHAHDATEALSMLDQVKPDVVVFEDEHTGETELFIDSLSPNHPPVVMRTDDATPSEKPFSLDKPITYIPKVESLDGIHETLVLATALGNRGSANSKSGEIH